MVVFVIILYTAPVIQEAEITAQTRVKIPPGEESHYTWDKNCIMIDIPAGATSGQVTMSIQAGYSGNYQLPENHVLVSGVYWLALNPPVTFAKKVTIRIQHCADVDSAPVFVTAKCTQKKLPYNFKQLPGGRFTYSDCGSIPSYGYGRINVEHFSGFAVTATEKSFYAFCTYYLSTKHPNHYQTHITVTPNLENHLEV